MAQTVAVTIANARLMLNEPTARRWTDVELRKWINDGQRDIARRIPWYRKSTTGAATASTQQFSFPSDAIRIDHVSWRQSGTTRTIPLEEYDHKNVAWTMGAQLTSATGYPAFYWTSGYPGTSTFTINLVPIPQVTGILTYEYIGMPADYTTSDTSANSSNVLVPLGYEDAITLFVVYSALQGDADPRWREYKELYEQALAGLEEAAAAQFSSSTGMLMGPMAGGITGLIGWDDGDW